MPEEITKMLASPPEAREVLLNPPAYLLREMASKDEIRNHLNLPLYHAKIKSRSAQFTEIIYEPNEQQINTINEVRKYLRDQVLICVERQVGDNPELTFQAKYYVTRPYARLAYMMTENFFRPSARRPADIHIICVPEWPERKVYVLPQHNYTYILGIDYYGESKMSVLRLVMHQTREQHDGLGLHAGSKIYRFLKGNRLEEKGLLVFGLSGTGKTTVIVYDHDLESPEGVEIFQDDIVLFMRSTRACGTERNFYPKTDSLTDQPELLTAATSEGAILENVFVTQHGEIDFDNQSVSTNGRAIAPRQLIPNHAPEVDMTRTDVIFFNTRRYHLPPIGRLISPEQAAAFFMLGESAITSAEDPQRVGESKRVVGFDPFVVDQPHINGNRFYEILKENPHIECYVLNTGKIGGVERGIKIPKEVTLKIVESVIRGEVKWVFDPILGYDIPCWVEGVGIHHYDPYRIYGSNEYENVINKLRQERIQYMERFPELHSQIAETIK